mmetsp:Transcript_13742/g.23436  ORF Transcript_13742/g.23436 Transcript_13742/m.23436 type:complete len:107 (+) Transcript_13742:759-1079(+)
MTSLITVQRIALILILLGLYFKLSRLLRRYQQYEYFKQKKEGSMRFLLIFTVIVLCERLILYPVISMMNFYPEQDGSSSVCTCSDSTVLNGVYYSVFLFDFILRLP